MKAFKLVLYAVTALVLLIGLFLFFLKEQSKNELPVYGEVPSFTLTERNGYKVKPSDLLGKPWIAGFIFTRCQGQCPIISSQMLGLQKQIKKLNLVSFSVDPEYDSPKVLSEYAAALGADPKRWFFLTGDREVLNRVTTGLHMNKIDEPMFHSASLVLVDSKGRVRGFYDANDLRPMKRLKRDYLKLIKE